MLWGTGDDSSEHSVALYTDDWDLDAPWLPWASYSPEPVGGLELDVAWRDVAAGDVLGLNSAPWAAEDSCWTLHALRPHPPAPRTIFALQVHTGLSSCQLEARCCWCLSCF